MTIYHMLETRVDFECTAALKITKMHAFAEVNV